VQPDAVLEIEQLRKVTMDDPKSMREILAVRVDDRSRPLQLLAGAIREGDTERSVRLPHYCQGACANVGANRAAGIKEMEKSAAAGEFATCAKSLAGLGQEVDLLRSAAKTL